MNGKKKGPGDQPGPETQNQEKEQIVDDTLLAASDAVTSVTTQQLNWALAVRERIQQIATQQTTDPEALRMLADLDSTETVGPLAHYDRLAILQGHGRAQDIDITLPVAPNPAPWARHTYFYATSGGCMTIRETGRRHGSDDGPQCYLERYTQVLVFPDETADTLERGEAGDTTISAIEITWDGRFTENASFTDPENALAFATALAGAAVELGRLGENR